MRLREGIFIKNEETFGGLKFSALRREVQGTDSMGQPNGVIQRRTYDLRCKAQGMMIQVSLPGEVPVKEIPFGTEVELINPMVGAVATSGFPNPEVDWYVEAEDIVPKGKQPQPEQSGKQQAAGQQGQASEQPNEKKQGQANGQSNEKKQG